MGRWRVAVKRGWGLTGLRAAPPGVLPGCSAALAPTGLGQHALLPRPFSPMGANSHRWPPGPHDLVCVPDPARGLVTSPFQRTPSAVLPPALGSSSLPIPHAVASPGCGRRALQRASRVSRAAGFVADSAVSPESFFRNSSEQRGATSPWSRPHARSAREVGERHERCGEREWRGNPPTGAGKPGRWDDSMTRCTVSARRLAHSGPVKTISHCCPPETAPPHSGI